MIDDDDITATTTLLSCYQSNQIGSAKVDAMLEFVRNEFEHLETAGINADVRTIGKGFWRAASRMGRVMLIACMDNYESVDYAAGMARSFGIPSVAATVGRDAVEVLVFPADPNEACCRCLGLFGGPAKPCLGRRDEAPATISTLDIGAISGGTACVLARQLAAGDITHTKDVHLTFRSDVVLHADVSDVARTPSCLCHEKPDAPTIRVSPMTTQHSWSQVAESLGDSQAVLLADALPPIETDTPEAKLPLREIGIPLWPIIDCESGGRRSLLEIAGDKDLLGLTSILEAGDDA